MMLPAVTASPPNFLTPRRRPAVSRPLRDEPPAFLCAMAGAPYSVSAFGAAFLAAVFFSAAGFSAFALASAAGFSALAAVFLAGALVCAASAFAFGSAAGSSAFGAAAFLAA